MKKSIVVTCILAAMLLSGCSTIGRNREQAQKTAEATVGSNTVIANTVPETVTTEPVTTVVTEPAVPGKIGAYIVTIEGATTCVDTEGNNVVIITYNFTNNSENVESLSSALMKTAFQNGLELDDASSFRIPDSMNYSLGDYVRDIQPGYGITCQYAYKLNAPTGNVEISFKDFDSGETLKYEIEI